MGQGQEMKEAEEATRKGQEELVEAGVSGERARKAPAGAPIAVVTVPVGKQCNLEVWRRIYSRGLLAK